MLELVTAERHDRSTDHDQRQTDGRQRHQDRCDVEQGGQDQADGTQDLDCSEDLDEFSAEIQGPSPARSPGQLRLRNKQLVRARNKERVFCTSFSFCNKTLSVAEDYSRVMMKLRSS